MTTLKWKSEYDAFQEVLTLRTEGKHMMVRSEISGELDGNKILLNYEMKLDHDWSWHWFSLYEQKDILLYQIQNQENLYIDFCMTPFTNTLPLKKEAIKIGEKREIDTIYVCYPMQELKTDRQEYVRINEDEYFFRQLSTGFEALIETDQAGFVTEYSSLFKRIQ